MSHQPELKNKNNSRLIYYRLSDYLKVTSNIEGNIEVARLREYRYGDESLVDRNAFQILGVIIDDIISQEDSTLVNFLETCLSVSNPRSSLHSHSLVTLLSLQRKQQLWKSWFSVSHIAVLLRARILLRL